MREGDVVADPVGRSVEPSPSAPRDWDTSGPAQRDSRVGGPAPLSASREARPAYPLPRFAGPSRLAARCSPRGCRSLAAGQASHPWREHRPGQGSFPSTRTVTWRTSGPLHHAELVALDIGQRRPHRTPLVVVADPTGAESEQAGDLGLAIGGAEIDVQPVLRRLALRDPDEQPTGGSRLTAGNLGHLLALRVHRPLQRG